ncbi:MAG: pilus assembly protein PilM [candidate division NC10 bacterium]|nr:pilus assembly protein PilM [candidate division NC10 bacterium]
MELRELIPRRKIGLGVDVRGGLLCHALLCRAFGRVRLLDWGVEELPHEGDGRDEALKRGLEGILGRLPARPTFVTVGLPRSLVTMRSVSMPAVGEEELKGILDYEVERHIPFPPEEAQYDFQVLERDAEKATLLLAAARKEEVSRYLGLLGEAGIRATALGVSTFASLNALFYNQGRAMAPLTALIDLRDGEAEIGIAKDGVLRYSRYLTLGPAAPLDVLLPELSGLLAHLEATGGLQGTGRIALSGSTRGRGDLLHHLAQRTGLEVELLHPFRRIKARGIDPQVAPVLGAAVGLALNGLVALPLHIDLLPKEVAPPRREPGLAMTFRLLVLIVALGLAYAVSYAINERRALADLTATVKRVQAEAAKVEQLKEGAAKLGAQTSALENIEREEIRKLDVLRELVQVLPKGVTLTLFNVDGREVRIGGSITGSASDLISILEESPVFENAQFTSPVARRDAETQEFQIKALLEVRKGVRS